MGKLKTVLVNLFIVLILLGNIQGMLLTWKIRMGKYALVRAPYFSNLFYIYGVYGTMQTSNCRFIAIGSFAKKDTLSGMISNDSIDLKIQDYFPQSHGEVSTRLGYLAIMDKPKLIKLKYERIASALKNAYNKKHPDKPVSRVSIYQYYWPPDNRGYNFREKEGKLLFLGSNQ